VSELGDLYQEMILDHGKRPRNRGELPGHTHHALGHNPLCGDRLSLYLLLDGNTIRDARFEGSGCAISMASASLMTESLKGRTVAEASHLGGLVVDLVRGEGHVDPSSLGKLAVFAGVAEFPIRVKCASLPWRTLEAAMAGSPEAASTE
jgi:nitrogen fixation NifU-like protein